MLILGIVGTFVMIFLILVALSPGDVIENWQYGGKGHINITCGPCQYFYNGVCINYECCNSTQCMDNEYCAPDHTCVALRCGWHQIAEDHRCVNYECLADADCLDNQKCENRTCVDVVCEEGLYAIDHGCYEKRCLNNDDCPTDERCHNGACKPIDCGYCAFPVNHTCIQYWCCSDIDCGTFGKCENHTCTVFKCGPDQYVDPNTNRCRFYNCVNDTQCDDGLDWTEDTCENPATVQSKCIHEPKVVEITLGKEFTLHIGQQGRYQGEEDNAKIILLEAWDNGAKIEIWYMSEKRGTKTLHVSTFSETYVDNIDVMSKTTGINIKIKGATADDSASFVVTPL